MVIRRRRSARGPACRWKILIGTAGWTFALPLFGLFSAHGQSAPRMNVDKPAAGSTLSWPFTISGWAVDLGAATGTGVDAVHVWAFPAAGGNDFGLATFLGVATLGIDRPDVGAFFGSARFVPSGFQLDSKAFLVPGGYRLKVFARSTVTGTFNGVREVSVSVRAVTNMNIDVPAPGSGVAPPFQVSGWAFNTGTPDSVGVDAAHVWAFPSGSGNDFTRATFLGAATLGIARPDVAAFFGVPEIEPAGFELTATTPLAAGSYALKVFVRDTATETFTARERGIVVSSDPRQVVDEPSTGTTVTAPFTVSGWAADLAAPEDTGVNAVHVWAFPASSPSDFGQATFLGAATLGLSRPDVAAFFGKPTLATSGYELDVEIPLKPASYALKVFARSSVTGKFNVSGTVAITAEPIVALEPMVTGLPRPIDIAHAGDGSGRMFIALQGGQILVHDGVELLSTPFLDISSLVSCCGERGLLGVTFHPNYASNGFFYVNYTDVSGDSVVARYIVSTDPDVAEPSSAMTLLRIPQPFANHNGGALKFGLDGYLYVGFGDGGSGGDPGNRAQNLSVLHGKILRVDVDSGTPYAIPPSNPFLATPEARPEIWAYGLRNPWRFSFDRMTGDLFIGDVGQQDREEIDFESAGSPGGVNYGWRLMEGSACFNPPTSCNDGSLVLPALEYAHVGGNCSVTGGYAYRGTDIGTLAGAYLYADFCSGRVWGGFRQLDGGWRSTELLDTNLVISSFGESEASELMIAHYSDTNGAIYRLIPSP